MVTVHLLPGMAVVVGVFMLLYALPLIDGYLSLNMVSLKILSDKEITERLHRRLHRRSGQAGVRLPDIVSTMMLATAELNRLFYVFEGIYLVLGLAALLTAPFECGSRFVSGFLGATVVSLSVYLLKMVAVSNAARAIEKLQKGG